MKSPYADDPIFQAGVQTERARISQLLHSAGVKLSQSLQAQLWNGKDVPVNSNPASDAGSSGSASDERSAVPSGKWADVTRRINERQRVTRAQEKSFAETAK